MKPLISAVRLLALILFLFASVVWAQEGVSPGAGTAAAPAAKGKKPALAKQSPPTKDTAAAPQKTEAPPGVPAVAPQAALVASEPAQMTLELKYNVDNVMLQGNRSRSFLHEGVNHTSEVNFLSNMPFVEGYRFETNVVGRYTDNPRVDPERNSLQRAYIRVSGRGFEATLGDSLVNYSRFSFSQNIKGLNVTQEWTDNLKFYATVGFFADRWGSLYRHAFEFRDITSTAPFNPAAPPKPYTRLVGGARLERKLGRSGWIAANYSHGSDVLQSLPHATITCLDTTTLTNTIRPIGTGCLAGETEFLNARLPASEASENDLFSADVNFDIKPLRMKVNGEVAYSRTAGGTPPSGATPANFACATQPPVVGAAVLDSRCFGERVGDPAYRLEASQKVGKLSWRTEYNRFNPNFSSANARQIRDLQDFNIRGDFQFARPFTLAASWRRSNDNLNGKRHFTSIVRAPEVRLIFRDFPFYKKMVLEVGYRERNLDTAGHPLATCVDPSVFPPVSTLRPASPGCLVTERRQSTEQRIRSTRIPFFSLTMPVGDTLFTFDYEHRYDKDTVSRQNSTDTDRYAFAFRGNYTWSNWDVSPTFRFEVERLDKRLPNNASLSLGDPSLLFPFDFFGAQDTNRSFNVGLQVEAPRYFRFEGAYREFNSIALSPLRASAALDPLLRFFYLNQGFKRPSWRAALTYKVGNDENKLITAFFERGNNFFATGDPFVTDLKSFRETVIGGTILFRFRR